MKKRLAIITTHPIQYNAPLFALIAERGNIEVHVFYTWGDTVLQNKYDPGFATEIKWDIPLLNGYSYSFLENRAARKGSDHFWGIDNPGIIDKILAYKPTALLVYGWSFKSHLRVMRYFKGRLPVLFRGDSTLIDSSRKVKDRVRMIFLKWVYRHINKALYTGKNNYDYYRAAGLCGDQLAFVPHVVDNMRFSHQPAELSKGFRNFREEFGIKATDFVFLFSGKMEPKKSPDLLVSAFCEAGFDETVHLVLVGDGPMGKGLKEKYSLHKKIHFGGFINQSRMPEVYKSSDLLVLPSGGPGETWGLAVNEAMACGKPVIVSDHCGCAVDLVKHGINGFVFCAGEKNDLMEKMKKAVNGRKNILEMGHASLEIIEGFSMERAAAGLEQVVMNI